MNEDLQPAQIEAMLHHDYRTLTQKNQEFVKLAKHKAGCEKFHQVAFAKKALVLRNKGTAVSILKEVVRGDPEISMLKYNWDVADAVYTACRESMKDLREHIGMLRSILTYRRAEFVSGGG